MVAGWTDSVIADLSPIDFRADKSSRRSSRSPARAGARSRPLSGSGGAVPPTILLAEDAAELVDDRDRSAAGRPSSSNSPGEFEPGRSGEAALLRHSYGDRGRAARRLRGRRARPLDRPPFGRPLETRGALGSYDAAREFSSCTAPPRFPTGTADPGRISAAARRRCRHESHVGGGFGMRGEIYPKTCSSARGAAAAPAGQMDRGPARASDGRQPFAPAAPHRCIAVDADGLILGIEDEILHDQGADIRTHGVNVPNMTMGTLLGAYQVPAYRALAHVRLTNKTPAATYRAPGRFGAPSSAAA